ncbi:HELZ2 [Symbiodinium sp. CCMP2592]|nr:HELZ2 [Symbiodinium sp. CCMP2592]
MQKGSKGGKKGGGKAAWDDGYVSHSGQSESPSRQNQTQSASVRGLDEDALRLSQPNLALPWAVLGLASPPKMYSEQGSRKATLKWLVHWVSCRSGVSDWASGERNAWQRSLGGNRNERYERFRTGIASLEVFASQGDRVPLSFLPQRPGFLHVAKPFCICLAHRRPEPEGSFAALCPEALDAVKRMKGSTVDASSSTEYADKWKGLIETEAVASAVDEGLGRHLADTLVEWEHCSDGELLGKFQVKASLLFAHKIKFRSAMLHGEWASSWICLRYQGRGEWFGHGAVLRACFLEDDKDLLFAEEEEEWKDSTQNLQLTFRVIPGSSPHDPEDGLYTLELIPKALADSCMASALHELKACPLVQSLVLTGQPVPESISAPKVDLSVWGLNDSQLSAVTFALQNPFALVQGPPGTGKTMTTAVLATCFARQNMASGANRAVLLCTPTNRAADCAAAFVARICQKQAELRLHERSEVEGNVCAICLCSKPDMITLCSHAFHRQCLLQALDVGSFCPVCRQQVKHVDTGLRILRIYGADIEKQEFPVPKRDLANIVRACQCTRTWRAEASAFGCLVISAILVIAAIPVLQKVELDCIDRNCSSVCFESNYTGVVECQNEFDWDTCRNSPKMYVCFELWQEGLQVKKQCESNQCFLGDVDTAQITYRASQLALLLSFLAAASCSCFKKGACNCRGAQVYTRQALLAVGNCCLVPSMLLVLLYFVLPKSFFYPPSYAFVGVPIELFVTVFSLVTLAACACLGLARMQSTRWLSAKPEDEASEVEEVPVSVQASQPVVEI